MSVYTATGYNDHYMYLNHQQQTMPNGLVSLHNLSVEGHILYRTSVMIFKLPFFFNLGNGGPVKSFWSLG